MRIVLLRGRVEDGDAGDVAAQRGKPARDVVGDKPAHGPSDEDQRQGVIQPAMASA
jgi:hypothetical protein